MANYDSNYAIAQEISARIGVSPIPFDSVYSIALEIYNELGGEPAEFDSVYSILLGILPLVEGGVASKVIDDNVITTVKTWSSSKINSELSGKASVDYVDEQIEAVIGAGNSEIEGKETEDFAFVQSLPVSGEEGQQVIIKGDNADTLYKYISGEWAEQTPDATKLYFDTENEALYSYVTAEHQFAPVSLVNTIVVGSNLNSNADLKALKTVGVYNVIQRLHNATKGDYVKNWTLYVESVDYEEYDKSDTVYQRLVSNYTIQKRTWSTTRATNDGWSNFSTYYAGEIKDTTTSKYYTWSSDKINTQLSGKQDTLTAGQNISIDSANTISALGYVFNSSDGSFATLYDDDGQLMANTASGIGSFAEGMSTTASGTYCNHAEGYQTQAIGTYGSHAEGVNTIAECECSHTEGESTKATGSGKWAQHAEGFKTIASGTGAHSEGYRTEASGTGSHAEGWGSKDIHNTASGDGSHVEGLNCIASGKGAHAEGWGGLTLERVNIASGDGSHVEGLYTKAQNEGEHASGINNKSHKNSNNRGDSGNTLFSIGCDSANTIEQMVAQNAFEIMQNADMYINGVGGYDGIHIKGQDSGITVQTVQEVISGINTSVASKQDALSAGSGITISGTSVSVDSSLLSEINGKQDTLTAGTNITISGTTISATYEVATNAEIDMLFVPQTTVE